MGSRTHGIKDYLLQQVGTYVYIGTCCLYDVHILFGSLPWCLRIPTYFSPVMEGRPPYLSCCTYLNIWPTVAMLASIVILSFTRSWQSKQAYLCPTENWVKYCCTGVIPKRWSMMFLFDARLIFVLGANMTLFYNYVFIFLTQLY